MLGDESRGKVETLGVAARLSVNSESKVEGTVEKEGAEGSQGGRKRREGTAAGETAAPQKDFHLLTKPMRPATREILVRKPPRERPLGGSGGRERRPRARGPGPAPDCVGAGGALGGPAASAVPASCSAASLTPRSWDIYFSSASAWPSSPRQGKAVLCAREWDRSFCLHTFKETS